MPPDAKEALTRKLGPLPAWGWGVAIGGAILVARLFRKPSVASGTGTAPTSVGGGMIGTGPDATPTDPFSGANSLVEQLQTTVAGQGETIAGLSGSIGTLTDYNALLTKLTAFLNQRSTILAAISADQLTITKAINASANCTTQACKDQQHAIATKARTDLAAQQTTLTTVNASIADLQQKINALGTTS